jgi:hypothetical protein
MIQSDHYVFSEFVDSFRERVKDVISELQEIEEVVEYMQDNRKVCWNLENLTRIKRGNSEPTRTIEFRGGRCFRGPARIKRWISFTVGFTELALAKVSSPNVLIC